VEQTPIDSPPQAALVASATLTYDVRYDTAGAGTRQAVSTVRWGFGDGKYRIEAVSAATGLAGLVIRGSWVETSVGDVSEGGLAPLRYGDARANRAERAVHFQRDRNVVSFSGRGDTLPLPDGVQDRLSLRFQLGLLLQAAPHLQSAGSVLPVPVATPSGVEIWNMVVQPPGVISTAAGDFPVLHLARQKRLDRTYDQTVEIWLTPSLSWLPVRIRIQDANERVLDATLSAAEVQ
jgi:Protein of unknown function (DUF3108)